MHRCFDSEASVQPVLKRSWSPPKHALWNKELLMHRCFDSEVSLQPVLKRGWNPPKHALWNKELPLHRCLSFDHRFNRCYTWFLPSSREDRPTGHRSFRHASDAPMLGHRFNRCCCFSLFSAELTWIRMWLWLFLLPRVVLTSIDHLFLFLSECAWFLRPT